MTLHYSKSRCCNAVIIRYGGKRRQCTRCKKTWTIRPKRRGRKIIQPTQRLIIAYFSKAVSNVRTLAKQRRWGRDRAQRMLARSLRKYIASHDKDWLRFLPEHGRLIAVADGIWHRIGKGKITVYMILLRPVHSDRAVICPPVFLPGWEDKNGWEEAFASLPDAVSSRICSLVCDGHIALVALGRRRQWHIQRCHFHLIANLNMYLGARKHTTAKTILFLVQQLITTANPIVSREICAKLRHIRITLKSRGVRRVLGGLETHYKDFQTYARYPYLSLPSTTNAAESCISGARDLMRRCRGFRSWNAMHAWLTGYTIWKRSIQCNGKKPTELIS